MPDKRKFVPFVDASKVITSTPGVELAASMADRRLSGPEGLLFRTENTASIARVSSWSTRKPLGLVRLIRRLAGDEEGCILLCGFFEVMSLLQLWLVDGVFRVRSSHHRNTILMDTGNF